MCDELVAEVLKKYGLTPTMVQPENYKGKKAVWFVETEQGPGVLKMLSMEEKRLKFIIPAALYLKDKGIRIPEIVFAPNGKPYVSLGEHYFVLSERLYGRTPRYGDKKERGLIMESLANFHLASEGFQTPLLSNPRSHLGKWPLSYLEGARFLEELSDLGDDSEFYKAAFKVLPVFVERCYQAIKNLEVSAYQEWVQRVEKKGGLCHQDYSAGNLLLEDEGQMAVLDLDSLTFDLPVRDLRKIINKVLKKRKRWNVNLFQDMLNRYSLFNPLSPEQQEVLNIDLLFPHLFLGMVDKYHRGRDQGWTVQKYLTKLAEIIEFELSKDLLSRRG